MLNILATIDALLQQGIIKDRATALQVIELYATGPCRMSRLDFRVELLREQVVELKRTMGMTV